MNHFWSNDHIGTFWHMYWECPGVNPSDVFDIKIPCWWLFFGIINSSKGDYWIVTHCQCVSVTDISQASNSPYIFVHLMPDKRSWLKCGLYKTQHWQCVWHIFIFLCTWFASNNNLFECSIENVSCSMETPHILVTILNCYFLSWHYLYGNINQCRKCFHEGNAGTLCSMEGYEHMCWYTVSYVICCIYTVCVFKAC